MPGTNVLTTDPGLYRVRHDRFDRLVYLGETGRSTRGRVGALARGTFADRMPFRDPHTAAPTLWAIRDKYGPGFELSWTTPSIATDDQSRKAVEAALIALHRRGARQSPVANFGRIIPGYRQSNYSRHGERARGGPLGPDESESNATSGRPPLAWTNADAVRAVDWMGVDWSEPARLESASQSITTGPGVYRLWRANAEGLAYIGQSQTLRTRLYRHRRSRDPDVRFTYAPLPDHEASHELLEVETDLIGAHYLATRHAPATQF
jgi:hypothetical protein